MLTLFSPHYTRSPPRSLQWGTCGRATPSPSSTSSPPHLLLVPHTFQTPRRCHRVRHHHLHRVLEWRRCPLIRWSWSSSSPCLLDFYQAVSCLQWFLELYLGPSFSIFQLLYPGSRIGIEVCTCSKSRPHRQRCGAETSLRNPTPDFTGFPYQYLGSTAKRPLFQGRGHGSALRSTLKIPRVIIQWLSNEAYLAYSTS